MCNSNLFLKKVNWSIGLQFHTLMTYILFNKDLQKAATYDEFGQGSVAE